MAPLPPTARFATTLLLATALALPPAATAGSWAWSEEGPCAGGGSWLDPECWAPNGVPNSREDAVLLESLLGGTVTIPTSSGLGVVVNRLVIGGNFHVFVASNMVLNLSRSSANQDPALQVMGLLTIDSPDIGGSSLNLSSYTTGGANPVLTISGAGEIHVKRNGSIAAGNNTRIDVLGGIEIYALGSQSQPAALFGEIKNQGGEVVAITGRLRIVGDLRNTSGGFVEIDDQYNLGNVKIELTGSIRGGELYPGNGIVELNGGRLAGVDVMAGQVVVGNQGQFAGTVTTIGATEVTVPDGQTLVLDSDAAEGGPRFDNDGVVRLGTPSGGATLRAAGGICELGGTGSVLMQGPGSFLAQTGGSIFRNQAGHSIVGRGYVQATVQNAGLVVADKGTLTFFEPLSSLGGDAVAQGIAGSIGSLSVSAPFRVRNLRIAEYGRIYVNGGRSVVVDGDFVVEGSDEGAFNWSAGSTLDMPGQGSLQGLEIGGQDLGTVNAGFQANFNLPRLAVRLQDTFVYLRDLQDNGNRDGGSEALYVDVLEVTPGATLELNGYCLYAKVGGVPYRVQAGDGAMFGGGTILDGTVTAVGDRPVAAAVRLLPPAPNPFNPSTVIRFALEHPTRLQLRVHDPMGRQLRELAGGHWPAGTHEIRWDGRDDRGAALASGSYFVHLSTPAGSVGQPLVLLK